MTLATVTHAGRHPAHQIASMNGQQRLDSGQQQLHGSLHGRMGRMGVTRRALFTDNAKRQAALAPILLQTTFTL